MNERYVTVIVTERCNLNCTYCYEKNKQLKTIQLDCAIDFLEKELNAKDGCGGLTIGFFGGEPFLEFDFIKRCTEYLRLKKYPKKYRFFVSTNGTLVHGDIQDWLRENADMFICGLSLDGTKKSHDVNRCNSFDMIDLDFFANTYPNQPIKMTISKDTLDKLAENVIFCHTKGFMVSCNLAYGFSWNADDCNKLAKQLDKLIDYYIKNQSKQPCSMFNRHLGVGNNGYAKKWCGVGNTMKVLDCNNKCYGCQLLTPLSSGKEDLHLDIPSEIPTEDLPLECKNCRLINLCPTCYSSNLINNGNPYKKDNGFCAMQKVILKKRAYYWAKRWEMQFDCYEVSEEKEFLKNISEMLSIR